MLAAWEEGLDRARVDRAPSLLDGLGLLEAGEDWTTMTVGECDRRLLRLRQRLFGEELRAVCRCTTCSQEIEVTLSAPRFTPSAGRDGQVVVELAGYRVQARLPLNSDLSALAALGRAPTAIDLLRRCVLRVESAAGEVGVAELPGDVGEETLATLALHDSGADMPVPVHCPGCDSRWPERLEVRDFLWEELTSWAYGLLDEVHRLALAYGWAERDILAMSDRRRRFYLQAADQ